MGMALYCVVLNCVVLHYIVLCCGVVFCCIILLKVGKLHLIMFIASRSCLFIRQASNYSFA